MWWILGDSWFAIMRAFWSDPYLWLHLAGIATVPLWLEVCLLGLAVGDPVLPVWLEVLLVGTIGIAPILWMQWQKPFCIFSLLFLSLSPAHMSEDQRRLLRLFKSSVNQLLAIPVAVGLLVVLWQLYLRAPLVASVAPFDGQRWFGLGVAAIAFFLANLFTQVPVSVLRVLLASDAQVAAQVPYPSEQVGQDFTLFGIRLRQVLPVPATVAVSPAPATVAASEPTTTIASPPPSTLESSPWDEGEPSPAPDPAPPIQAEPSAPPAMPDGETASNDEPPSSTAVDEIAGGDEETIVSTDDGSDTASGDV